MAKAWRILKTAVSCYIAHDALSRGAAIAFYTVTSLAPVLLIVTAIAGIAFGEDSVRAAISAQLNGLVGDQGADLVKSLLAKSTDPASGTAATVIGIVTLVATASGVFGEMQTALNITWNVKASDQPIFSLIRARAASLGLVATLGFLMMVSLAASTALSAIGDYLSTTSPLVQLSMALINTIVSLAIFTLLFGAIYKVLPDTPLTWRDVALGGFVTAVLFTGGKSLIGWYLGQAAPSSGYGAAGALIVLLLWTYYSSQIFLFGAELTKAMVDAGQTPQQHPQSWSSKGLGARRGQTGSRNGNDQGEPALEAGRRRTQQ
jgi:membrane protein